jgi:hypothetical protein
MLNKYLILTSKIKLTAHKWRIKNWPLRTADSRNLLKNLKYKILNLSKRLMQSNKLKKQSSYPNHPPPRSLPPLSTSSCWILDAWVMPSKNDTCSSCWGTRNLSQLYCSEGLNMGGCVKTSTLAVTTRVPLSLYLRSNMGTA